ncbi:MAG: hypothetical protein AB1490_01590 [Pseudomonadota bacterium]
MAVFTFHLGPDNAVPAELDDVHAARTECELVARELACDSFYEGYVLVLDDQGQEIHRSYLTDYRP